MFIEVHNPSYNTEKDNQMMKMVQITLATTLPSISLAPDRTNTQ